MNSTEQKIATWSFIAKMEGKNVNIEALGYELFRKVSSEFNKTFYLFGSQLKTSKTRNAPFANIFRTSKFFGWLKASLELRSNSSDTDIDWREMQSHQSNWCVFKTQRSASSIELSPLSPSQPFITHMSHTTRAFPDARCMHSDKHVVTSEARALRVISFDIGQDRRVIGITRLGAHLQKLSRFRQSADAHNTTEVFITSAEQRLMLSF